jgi:hypothetical protein
MSDQKYCKNCNHECHCESNVCDKLIGVGMSDKFQSCGCGVCHCATPKEESK